MTMTRRTALAGAAALPLAPAAAVAQGARPDPILVAFAQWQAVREELLEKLEVYNALEREEGACSPNANAYHDTVVNEVNDRCFDLEMCIANTVPQSVAGIAAQLNVMIDAFGYLEADTDDMESGFLFSLRDGAERLAEGA